MQPVDEQAGVLKWAHASLVFDGELARAHRYGHPLTVLRVKVDRWDIAKVTLGPEIAGKVLAEVGALLVSSSRVVDVVAYHGDAKFDLLLPDTADLGAVVVARRISAHTSTHDGIKLRVGVARWCARKAASTTSCSRAMTPPRWQANLADRSRSTGSRRASSRCRKKAETAKSRRA